MKSHKKTRPVAEKPVDGFWRIKLILLIGACVAICVGLLGVGYVSAWETRTQNQVLFDTAMKYIDEGDYIRAYQILDEIGDAWGDVRETKLGIENLYLAQMAAQYLESGDLDNAEAQAAAMEDPQRTEQMNEISYQRGVLCYKQGRYLDALGYLLPLRDWRFEQELVYECIVGAKKELAEILVP